MRNNFRFDLSDYLIHFFRDIDLNSGSYIHFPEHAGFNNIYEDTKLDALFLLRCALRQCKLIPSWSYRNAKRTIYGESPAICFTEMPLAAFVQTSNERFKRGEHIHQYAILLPKSDMFKIGARPVIYALSSDNIDFVQTSNRDERIINPSLLPLAEQFRYVTYNPSSYTPIDWTHEREWRWAYTNDLTEYTNRLSNSGISEFSELPNLNLKDIALQGAGIVIPKDEDIKKVLFDILTLIDGNYIKHNTFKFILSMENINYQEIIHPNNLANLIAQNLIDIEKFYNMEYSKRIRLNNQVNDIIVKNYNKIYHDTTEVFEYGKSWIWIVDNQVDVTRALVLSKRIKVNKEGKYLLGIENIENKSLREQEWICKNIASDISKKFSIHCNYFSTLNTNNPDEVPFYSDFYDIEHPYWNVSSL